MQLRSSLLSPRQASVAALLSDLESGKKVGRRGVASLPVSVIATTNLVFRAAPSISGRR